MREAFEYWFSDQGKYPKSIEKGINGNYKLMAAYSAWATWQAAWRAAKGDKP